MITNEHKVFLRKVNDPLFSIVKQFFSERHEIVQKEGNLVERHLADIRYSELRPEDFVIESVYTDDDGSKKICLVKRDKSFARVDIPIIPTNLLTILKDFNREVVTCRTLTDFKNKFNRNEVQGKLLHLVWRNAIGICLKDSEAVGLQKFDELTGELFFDKVEFYRSEDPAIEPVTLTSGGVLVTDESVGMEPVHLFIEELITEQLVTYNVTDNFPSVITGKRGDEFRHINSFLAEGVDVTAKTELSFVSKNGYVSGKQTPNKLESVFTFIRGTSDTTLTDEVEIWMTVTHNEYVYTKTVTIQFTIEQDALEPLIVTAQATNVLIPTLYKVGLVVKCTLGGNSVTPDSYPNWLTCKLTNDKYILDKSWKDGLLYTGVPTTIIPDFNASFKDLITGIFGYQGSVGTLFIDLEVIKPLGGQDQLELTELTPSNVKGEKGDLGVVSYQVNLKGSPVSLNQCGVNTGIIGQKELLNITAVNTGGFDYTLVKDSNSSGMVIADNININLKYPASNGELHIRTDQINVEVMKVSNVDLVPRPSFNKNVSRYQKGPLPFQIYINGNESSDKITHIEIEDTESSPVIINFDPWTISETWIVVDGPSTTSNKTVVFNFTVLVDGVEKVYSWNQEFSISGYQGGDIAVVPGEQNVQGRELESGEFIISVYNKRERINERVAYQSTGSTIPSNISFIPLKKVTPQGITVGYNFLEYGDVMSILRFVDPSDPGPVGQLKVNSQIGLSYPLKLTMDGSVDIEPYLSNKIGLSIIYNNLIIPLTDPRVTLNIKLSSPEVSVKTILSDGIVLETTRSVAMNEVNVSEIDVEVSFLDDTSIYRKEIGGLIRVVRKTISAVTVELLTTVFIPSTEQELHYKLVDGDGEYIYNARPGGVGYENDDNRIPTILSTDGNISVVDQSAGIYRSSLMLSHFGGSGGFYLNINLGGTIVRSNRVGIIVDPITPKASNVTDGIAVLNVNTDIDFTATLDKYNNPNVPLDAVSIGEVTADPTFIRSINNVIKRTVNGEYRINLTSTGKIGITQLRVPLTDADRTWDVIVNVNMIR